MGKPDRPVFIGNFDYDCSAREIERLMEKYGPVKNIDMKTGALPFRSLSIWHTCNHFLVLSLQQAVNHLLLNSNVQRVVQSCELPLTF